MKSILFAVLGLTASTVYGSFAQCQKGCAVTLGACMVSTFNVESCMKQSASCAVGCLSKLTVEKHVQKKVDTLSVHARQNLGVCQKNCGIQYAQCLVSSFNLKGCSAAQAACALGCFMGEKTQEHKAPVVELDLEVKSTFAVCQKSCAIEYGQCLVTTFDLKGCTQKEAACAIGCLGKLNVEKKQHFELSVKSEFLTCQKNCGISYAQCLITKFSIKTCTQEQAACAIGCLGKLETQTVKKSHHNHSSVKGLKCSACKFAANKIESIINKSGCGSVDAGMTAACEKVFKGPFDPVADVCSTGFISACPTLLNLIEKKAFSADKACSIINLC